MRHFWGNLSLSKLEQKSKERRGKKRNEKIDDTMNLFELKTSKNKAIIDTYKQNLYHLKNIEGNT